MLALVSGQAGLGIARRPDGSLCLRLLDGEERPLEDGPSPLFGCTDVRQLEVRGLTELDTQIELAWANDRALQLLLLCLDWSEPLEERLEFAQCVEELLQEFVGTDDFILNRLMSAPLPNDAIATVDALIDKTPLVMALLHNLRDHQEQITLARSAFDRLALSIIGGEDRKSELLRSLIERGAFKDLVVAMRLKKSLKFLLLTLQAENRSYSEAIGTWLRELSAADDLPRRIERSEPAFDEDDWDQDSEIAPSRGAFEQVRAQQNTIVERLKQRDIAGARVLGQMLIEQQRSTSTSEQIGKSLCFLAQRAKHQEVNELQLEWARWATEESPLDPKTYGHLADALLDANRFAEAHTAFEEVARVGDARFANVGLARVKRAMGYPAEARERLLELAKEYDDDPQVVHAYYAAADALRDLGDLEQAKVEFGALTERFPLESMFWEGLATTQFELGEIGESLRTFSKAKAQAKHGRAVSLNGLARAYRLLGRFVEAQRIYEDVIGWFPNNKIALCGKAELLRVAGRIEAALQAFDVAIERCPFSPEPVTGKGNLLLELRRFDEAAQLYGEATARFDRNVDIAAGNVDVLKAQGKYADALAKADALVHDFPYFIRGQVVRASLLHRLGKRDLALNAYEQVLRDRPFIQSALTGKVAVLISLQRFDEAEALLPKHKPKTQTDWARCVLRAMCAAQLRGYHHAIRMLRTWEASCPFVRQRKMLRSALVRAELGLGQYLEARRLVEAAPTEVSNVVAIEALAAGHRTGAAKERLRQLEVSERSGLVIDLAREIARRHGLINEEPLYPSDWVPRMQREVLLQEAA